MYVTSCFDENICLVSKNFPLESHRKITLLERVLLLLAEDVVGCWGLADFSLSCLPFSSGFVGGSWRGEKELDLGRFTTSNSSSFHWVHAGVEVGFSYSLFVAQNYAVVLYAGGSLARRISRNGFFRWVYIQFLPKGFNLIFKKRDFCFQQALISFHGYIIFRYFCVFLL